ncbi:hypothetical protein FRC12_022154 [Ceratobasidium sp. 428]|nr:hypothetical protein FRC12_022154 [Ceratobasidium sp. 428]
MEVCQGNTRLKNLDMEIQAEILASNQVWPMDHALSKQGFRGQTAVAGPSTLEPGPTPDQDNNEGYGDDGGYNNLTLPPFPVSFFDERTDADDPEDNIETLVEDDWGASPESPPLDDMHCPVSGL